MFLKSLEIRGFKSFADKTELKFNNGITAVVGPNGSGKSNVSDAVRWVLGEQSAKTLRGSKMEDIIFAGTEYRKPIGLAQVSLTLDNSKGELPIDYHDVKVTRRIFKSGESEYLINNTSCRLKDIISLFMDTGIGKEGYSLIGQGKIDAILSGKPEDRRALLEEAAGIVKFKSRKIEAEKKLNNTKENLIRINDIIYTYEERLIPLEIEKNKALEYIEFVSELKKKEIALIINNLLELNNCINEQKNKINFLNKKNEEKKEKYKLKRIKLNSVKNELDNLDNRYNEDQKKYFFKKEKVSQSLSNITLLDERIKNIKEILIKNKESIKKEKENLNKINIEKNNFSIQFKEEKTIYDNLESSSKIIQIKLIELEKKLNLKEDKVKALKNEEFLFLKTVSDFNSKKAILKSEIKAIDENICILKDNYNNYKNSIKINSFTKNDLYNELNIKISEKNNLNEIINNNLNERTIIEKRILDVENKLLEITGNLHRLEANKDMLIKLENQYEGYNVSVRKIMESIESGKINIKKDNCTLLGEVISTKKGYERAMEISLGGAISNVITQDDKIAKILIDYLKKYKIGRATFLPLSIIKGRKLELSKEIIKQKGFLGIASDLIEYKKIYDDVINYILGKTIICDNIDNALVLAKKINYKYKIVTLAGEVINSGGALTGGIIQQRNMGIMSRKAEVENLKQKIIKINLEKNIIVNLLNDLHKEKKVLECEREKSTEKLYNNNLIIADIKNKIKSIDDDIIKIKKDSEKLEEQLKNYKEKSKENYKEIEFIEEKIKAFENEHVENKEREQNLELTIKELINKINKIKEEYVDLKIKKAKTQEIIENKEKDIKRIIQTEEDLQNKIIDLEKEILKNEKSKKESYSNIEFNKNFIENEKNELILLEEKAKEFEVEKIKLKESLKILESTLEILTVEIAKKDDEIHKNEIIYTKQDNEKSNYYLRLKEEFNTTFEEEIKSYEIINNIETHKSKISKLKSKISSLGSVNVNAIEEFKEISSKYKFMITEKDDLEKAQEQLINVIEEMTSKMRVVFRQNFNILNKYFDETFKELFKGGNAKLILQEGDELLGNIEIKVQPPGKKVQNINLMSGGEKVLSAIAILFAILKMKPTPFCILDEIEAALDDSNVNRYAEFLKEFSNKIQFIVITHRKGTMEAADIMYGVTMEEKGVSKLVSVNLAK